MIRVVMNIDESWVFEVSETLEDILDTNGLGDLTLKTFADNCVEFCRIYHNFCLDQNNTIFNSLRYKLNQNILKYSVDLLPTFHYYCDRLFQTLRGAFYVHQRLITRTEVFITDNGAYYLVTEYE